MEKDSKNASQAAVKDYVEKTDGCGNTSLILAASNGQQENVRSLLASGANPFAKNEEGWTALHYACANGYLNVIKLLIAHNKHLLEVRDNEGRTAFHKACNYGRLDAAKLLAAYGADLESIDDKGKTPLHAAVCSARVFNEAFVRWLVKDNRVNLEAETGLGWTPLHSAARYGNEENVKLLIQLGANKEARNTYGETPLVMVVSTDRMGLGYKIPIVKTLLAEGCSVEAVDTKERTALHWSCILGERPLMEMLLRHRANIDAKDEGGKTALHYASEGGFLELTQILIAYKKRLSSSAETISRSSLAFYPPQASSQRSSYNINETGAATYSQSLPESTQNLSASSTPVLLKEILELVKTQNIKIQELERRQQLMQEEIDKLKIANSFLVAQPDTGSVIAKRNN